MSRGRIHPDDIAAVRTRVPIEDVISERVTLRRVGSSLSGLCPFHDDSSPSFTVSPGPGLWHCFGCGESGDLISFVMRTEGLPFAEAVEKLADKAGITLRYLDADPNYVAPPPGQRQRLIAANNAANDFFRAKIDSDADAAEGRKYLTDRDLDEAAWARFSIGFAPKSYDSLLNHLKTAGFTQEEAVLAGLAAKNEESGRIYDRFRGRLTWPIRDLTGDIIGFGARRLFEDDKGPKWLNTPDTPLYRKSEVLYGIDVARKDIAATKTVVVVEGYGDVMACHLSGVTTAVATCGTAFGDGHVRIVRRLLRDDDAYNAKVIFTFDGDAAGQKAALRAFKENTKFTAQTYVAVAPNDMDPLDLRLHDGEQAVRDLIANAVPLVEFVIKSSLTPFNLAGTEGRVNALKVTAPIVAGIKDGAMRTEYTRRLSGWLSLPEHSVTSAVNLAARNLSTASRAATSYDGPTDDDVPPADDEHAAPAAPKSFRPDPNDPMLTAEREAAKCLLQFPAESARWTTIISKDTFTHAGYRGIYALVMRFGGDQADPVLRLHAIREKAQEDPQVAAFVNELAVEQVHRVGVSPEMYVDDVMVRLQDKALERKILTLKTRLGEAGDAEQASLLTEIVSAESQRRALRRK